MKRALIFLFALALTASAGLAASPQDGQAELLRWREAFSAHLALEVYALCPDRMDEADRLIQEQSQPMRQLDLFRRQGLKTLLLVISPAEKSARVEIDERSAPGEGVFTSADRRRIERAAERALEAGGSAEEAQLAGYRAVLSILEQKGYPLPEGLMRALNLEDGDILMTRQPSPLAIAALGLSFLFFCLALFFSCKKTKKT